MKRLYDLEPHEVSLVKRGANKKRFLVMKSHKGKEMAKTSHIEQILKKADPATLAKIESILAKAKVKKTLNEEDDKIGKTKMSMSDGASAAMKAAHKILAPHADEMPEEMQKAMGIHKSQMAIPEKVLEEHKISALEEAKKAYSAHLEKLGYQKYPPAEMQQKSKDLEDDEDDEDEEDDVEKSAITKSGLKAEIVEIVKSATKELVEKNLSLQKQLTDERDLRVTKEFEERVSVFKSIGADKSKLAKALKDISEKSPEAFAEIEAVLKASDAQLSQGGIFKTLGTSQSGAASDESKLEAMINSVVEKSDGTRTKEQIASDIYNTPEGKKLLAASVHKSRFAREG